MLVMPHNRAILPKTIRLDTGKHKPFRYVHQPIRESRAGLLKGECRTSLGREGEVRGNPIGAADEVTAQLSNPCVGALTVSGCPFL